MSWKMKQRALYNENPALVRPEVAKVIKQERQREKMLQDIQRAAMSINFDWIVAADCAGVDRPTGRKLGSRLRTRCRIGNTVRGP